MSFDWRHIISYTIFIVTKALYRTETLFFIRWPWSDLSRSPKVKLIIPSDSRHIISYTCFIVTTALSHTETLFFNRWPWSGLSRSLGVAIEWRRSWITQLLLKFVFFSMFMKFSIKLSCLILLQSLPSLHCASNISFISSVLPCLSPLLFSSWIVRTFKQAPLW